MVSRAFVTDHSDPLACGGVAGRVLRRIRGSCGPAAPAVPGYKRWFHRARHRPGPRLAAQPARRHRPEHFALALSISPATLSRVAQYSAQLDGVFVALADPTRRAVIRRLGRGPTSVGDLAREFPMTLPSFMKHVRTLETNGLIRTTKAGRVRTCVLNRERLALVDDWLAEQRRIWEERTDRLEHFVTDTTEGQR